MMIMRELTGGLYFGDRKTETVDGVVTATDTLTYNENEIRRIAKRGFDIAMKRRKKVTSVDKANVLDSSRLWRKIVILNIYLNQNILPFLHIKSIASNKGGILF